MNSAFVLPHKTRLHAVRGCVHKTYTCNASNDKPKPPPHIKMTDREVIQIDSDSDEDEDLRRAIALSLQDADAVKSQTDAQPEPEPEPPRDKVVFGALQLDRKKMEEERLQRLGKRPRATSDTESSQTPPAKRVLPEDSKPKLQYPEGTVKRTWARGYPRTGEDIKIEEVFKPQELQLAVLSSFQWDEEWLLKKIDIRKTKVLLLASAPDEQTKTEMNVNAPANIRFAFPPMNGFGAMHSKLQLLKYANSLRIAVPTGNLVSYDWGETGIMENMVFLIDLPRLDDLQASEPTDFSENLKLFLKLSGVDTNMIDSLSNYDFSKTKDVAFVYTRPGGHTGNDLERTGYPGLCSAVKSLGLATSAPVEVDFVCSSLGSINNDFMAAIYGACQGIDGKRDYDERAGRKAGQIPQETLNKFKDRLRVYFPKDETVAKSRGGRNAGGTICVQSKWWRSPTFPRGLFRDCVNTRDGLLMHSKVIYVRHSPKEGSDLKEAEGWAYIGSANLSESAWGRITKDKAKNTKLTCRNWECGVVLPVRKAKPTAAQGLDMFRERLPVPMKFPASRYGEAEEPWFFQER